MDHIRRIRDLREDHDYTQAAIAALLHIGQKTYSDYELDKIRIPVEHMIALAKFYGVSMDYICGLTNNPNPAPEED